MLDRFGLRPAVAAVGTALTAILTAILTVAAGGAPAAAAASSVASSVASSRPAAGVPAVSPASALVPAPATPTPAAIGGTALAGHGVVVNYAQVSGAKAGSAASVPKLPGVQAAAFVIADAGTGQVLAARDPHGWYRPASTLKMLTAISLIPLLNPGSPTVASKMAAAQTPNVVGLLAGHPYRISDLFTALLTISANDAAVALAQATGSFSGGMAVINSEARHLQADDTVAVDPNGLDASGQHTSAYDLALIARQALQMPAFLKYDQTRTAKFVVSKKKTVTLVNQNSLLTTYPGALGGKIGWTSAAGATYIGLARRNGVTLIVTLLHCPALTEVDAAKSLLNWGFKVDGKVTPVGTLVGPLTSPTVAAPASTASSAAAARPSRAPARSAGAAAAARAGGTRPAAGGPSALTAAGFSCVALVLAGMGFAYSRRQRPAARYQRSRPDPRA
jgi:serine-type D-Ala-D-Ala carboxypeptidase (penicillin-binding protein 5/6)